MNRIAADAILAAGAELGERFGRSALAQTRPPRLAVALLGFDFAVEASGRPLLLEINPNPALDQGVAAPAPAATGAVVPATHLPHPPRCP